eukprot:1160364-Pelagomonas_calceolata.AAC.8
MGSSDELMRHNRGLQVTFWWPSSGLGMHFAERGASKEAKQGVKLRGSQLSTSFHLRDLLGKGWLQRMNTASGVMIKAAKD